MTNEMQSLLSGDLLDEDVFLSLLQLCRACRMQAEQVQHLVEEGVVEPVGRDPQNWRFSGVSVRRLRCAIRLERDLGVNPAGAALALDLIEELETLRARLQRLEG